MNQIYCTASQDAVDDLSVNMK